MLFSRSYNVSDIPADADRLSRDVAAGGRTQEQRRLRHVLRCHHAPQRGLLEIFLFHLRVADADRFGAFADDALDARSRDNAGQDGIDADAERPELLGEALGHSDDRPFGGGVRQPVRVAEAPSHRRDVHDRSLFRLLEHRHGAPRAVEVAVEIDVDRAPPLPRIDVLHFARGAGDAGVVDQHVEPAEPSLHVVEQAVDRGFVGDVGFLGDDARLLGATLFNCFPRNVADVDAGVVGGKGLGNDAPDARRSGGDEDAQARLHASVYWVGHGLFSAPLAPDRYLLWARIIWDAKKLLR